MKKKKVKMQDIWDATRPNVYANKKKYKRKAKYKDEHYRRRSDLDEGEDEPLF
jgi:hypothetical protein